MADLEEILRDGWFHRPPTGLLSNFSVQMSKSRKGMGEVSMRWYIKVLANYFNFEGRARRKEYWMFVLFNALVGFCLGLVVGICKVLGHFDAHMLTNLYLLSIVVPSAAVAVRRMHDTGHSGWWALCPLYNFVLLVVSGTD